MQLIDQIFVYFKNALLQIADILFPDLGVTLASILISITGILIFGPLTMLYLTLIERKLLARIQNRFGPNRVGKFGLLQPVADGIKMLTKEDIVPAGADRFAHLLAPIAIVIPSLLVFSVIPFGKNMTAVDLSIGILFFLAISSTTTVWIFTAAWGSRNKFSVLGGMRTVAQMISYEIPLVLAVVPVILAAGSFSTVQIVESQPGLQWFVFTPWGLLGFVLFFIAGIAECNRTPFDLPEGESEIIAGFHTEYSGMKFGLFYMAEFMNMFTVSALVVTAYLGGWQGPLLPSWFWFLLKTYALIFVMMWIRGTLPRFRVDQLMGFSWKALLPLTLINLLIAGIWAKLQAPANFFVSLLLAAAAVGLIYFANKKEAPKKRKYHYAYAD